MVQYNQLARRDNNQALAAATAAAYVAQNYPQIIEYGVNSMGSAVRQVARSAGNAIQSAGGRTQASPAANTRSQTQLRARQQSRSIELRRDTTNSRNVRRRMEPVENNPSSTQMGETDPKVAKVRDEEVPVMPVPKRVSKILPDYFNITFPCASIQYQDTGTLTQGVASITGGNAAKTYVVLNKLSNIVSGGTGGPGATGNSNGRGISQFINLYKYYRVTQCDVRVTVMAEVEQGQTADPADLMLIGFHLNDTPSVANWSTFRDFLEMKEGGCKFYSPGGGVTDRKIQHLQYTYTPETWKTHVTETGQSERWTPVGATPPHAAYAHFGAVCADYYQEKSGVNQYGLSHNYKVKFLIETLQHVQFREIQDNILNDQQT